MQFPKQIVSSTYLLHNDISLDNVGTIFCSSSTIKMLAKTGTSGDPVDTASVCTYALLFRVNCAFLCEICKRNVHLKCEMCKINLFNVNFLIDYDNRSHKSYCANES